MLTSHLLANWDRCHRLGVWAQSWEPIKITPLGAVYSALHHVLTLPQDEYRTVGPTCASDHVMTLAGERGLQTESTDPYGMAKHYAHMAEVLARAIRQPETEPLVRDGHIRDGYRVDSYLVEGGTRLLRYVLIDHWDENRAQSLLHSWDVIGDVCVTRLPMTLRALIIGHSKNNRRHGYWTRCSQHPSNRGIRFARKHNREEGFSENWKRVYREETGIGPDAWLMGMARDRVLAESVKEIKVRVPQDEIQIERVLSDIKLIGKEIRKQAQYPMTRSSCDHPVLGPCRYQCVCYAPCEMTPGESGMFRPRKGA